MGVPSAPIPSDIPLTQRTLDDFVTEVNQILQPLNSANQKFLYYLYTLGIFVVAAIIVLYATGKLDDCGQHDRCSINDTGPIEYAIIAGALLISFLGVYFGVKAFRANHLVKENLEKLCRSTTTQGVTFAFKEKEKDDKEEWYIK